MYKDSKFIQTAKINSHKTKRIIDEVLMGALDMNEMKYVQKKPALMLDFSRDVSNSNEFIIAVRYFDEIRSKVVTRV